ncbi:MAG TPA: oxalate/formate MFS antiporter, partial [Methylovirgula sp.]
MSVAAGKEVVVAENSSVNRWVQLLIGVVCMTMIANLQYGWTLFVGPLH